MLRQTLFKNSQNAPKMHGRPYQGCECHGNPQKAYKDTLYNCIVRCVDVDSPENIYYKRIFDKNLH